MSYKVEIDAAKFTRAVRDRLVMNVTVATMFLQERVVAYINEHPRSGAEYARGQKTHRASGPGEPPAPDTGRHVGSITHHVLIEDLAVIGRVVAAVNYAGFLEFGTSKMAARPYLRPMLIEHTADIQGIVAR